MNAPSRPRGWHEPHPIFLAGLFLITCFFFLYRHYPFDGMAISDSWFLYVNEGKEFKWWTKDQLLNQAPGREVPELTRFTSDWSLLTMRRGLMPVVVLLIDRLAVGNHQVFVNWLCVLVQLLNAALFGWVLWKLAGPRWFLPVFCCAVLYPFAAASRFWQYVIINNLAVTCFLLSLGTFLCIDHTATTLTGRNMAALVLSAACFWISVLLVEYAILMGPLYLYLALYYSNGGGRLLRFQRLRSPSMVFGLIFVLISLLAIALVGRDVPTFLVYAPRFQELASHLRLPAPAIALCAITGNAVMFFVGVLVSNSIGYLVYPLLSVVRHYHVLLEHWDTILGLGIVAGLGAAVLRMGLRLHHAADEVPRHTPRFLWVCGGLWVLLAYLPFSTAFGYPRVVGLAADRVNILAMWGVSLCLGLFLQHVCARLGKCRINRVSLIGVALFMCVGVLAGNMYIQKEYYVELYRKERQVATLVLDLQRIRASDKRWPIVLLKRKEQVVFPRAQLIGAVQQEGALSKVLGVMRFLTGRYFAQEYVTSSFHLGGMMMFGCCPNSASVTFDGYARFLHREPVAVYKDEPPMHLEQDDRVYRLGYQDSEVWSKSFGSIQPASYSKRRYRLFLLEIDEPFFYLRGPLVYRLVPFSQGNPI